MEEFFEKVSRLLYGIGYESASITIVGEEVYNKANEFFNSENSVNKDLKISDEVYNTETLNIKYYGVEYKISKK